MVFISKVELKRQLQSMGIKVEGNYVKRSDIYKVLSDEHRNLKGVQFYYDCTGWPEEYADALRYIRDEGVDIERSEFLKAVNLDSYSSKNADELLPEDDWHIRYKEVEKFGVYFFIHSGIEHVFSDEKNVDKIQKIVEND
jgi:hypothetical protein